jgi:1-acyl-sn-glycerol-3-phosphate acyltransferase
MPHVLVVNHASFLDAIALSALLPAKPGYAFVARQEFPVQRPLCPLVRGVGTVMLQRPGMKHRRSSVELLIAALQRGESLVVFPEGGFGPEPGLKAFHSGAFAAAANASVPVVVAGLRGARAALRPGTWLPRRVGITLEIGPTLTPDGSDRIAIAQLKAAARAAMLTLCGETDAPASIAK